LEVLLEKHFPNDPNLSLEHLSHQYSLRDVEIDSMISLEKVKRALKSFRQYKSAGRDGIFPAMLQYGPLSLLQQMTCVIKACLGLGYTPKDWRVMKIVFIPKPGKDSYERASSWGPISLTSFWLKTMERLIDWHIRTPTLIGGLKRAGQYAHMAGVSTEAALHQVVARIERTLKSGEFGISTTLDVEGAFSHATQASIVNGLYRNLVDEKSIRWILRMLTNRTAIATLQGVTRERRVERGCPQGKVLSPL